MPADIPLTTPEVETVPTAKLLLAHVPPAIDGVIVVVEPVHNTDVPPERVGVLVNAFTVITFVAAVPQPVE